MTNADSQAWRVNGPTITGANAAQSNMLAGDQIRAYGAENKALRHERDRLAARVAELEMSGDRMALEIEQHAPCSSRGIDEAAKTWRALQPLGDQSEGSDGA